MDDHARETLRQRLERLLDAIDGHRPAPARPALEPVPVGATVRRLPRPRTVRPIRAWSRLIRI